MNSTPESPKQPPTESRRSVAVRTVGMIAVGAALLLLVMSLTILRNEPAGSHPPLASAPSVYPTFVAPSGGVTDSAATSTPLSTNDSVLELSEYEKAGAARHFLTGAAAVDELKIYDRVPPDSQLMLTFPREGKKQISSTFLIIGEDEDTEGRLWYHIRLPIRPNGSTGWVKATDLTTSTIAYSIGIDLSEHRLDLYEAGQLKKSYPVGVGTGDNPSPPGDYYITIKMKPTRPNGVYGVLAMGVSGFSEKLTDWPEGGQIGIHGTNDPSSIGKDVSHGCIRLHNEDVLDLSQYVAYGTPVSVQE